MVGCMDISGLTSSYSNFLTNQASANAATSKLEDSLKSDYSQASDEELMDVCKTFESYFLEQMFKGMMNTIPKSDESESSSSALVDYFKDLTIQDIAKESTEQNSLGLAQMMYEQMKRNYDL